MANADWSEKAITDLEDIVFYIGIHDGRPTAAERITREVIALSNLIAAQPKMGALRPEFGNSCRAVTFENRWVILYRQSDDGIEVLRFVDGRRDYDRLL